MFVLPDDQINSIMNCLTAKSTWDDLILYHKVPSDVKESRIMDLKLCYNTFEFKEGKTLTQTFTIYKALMYELVNDGINLLKLEINTGFINRLPKKWLSFCQSLRNTNHVKESELAFLFDSPDDKEDTRSSQEYMNDLEEEYQARALLAKSKRFFKKGTQRFSSAKATDQTECHKCGRKVSSDDNEMVEVKVLMALAEDNDAVSKEGARNGEWVKISMRKCISEQIPTQKKRIMGVDQLTEDPSSYRQKDLVFVKSSDDDIKVSIPGVERPWLSEVGGFILPNHDIGRILTAESQRNTTDPSFVVTDSLATDYDLADESLVYSTHLPPLEKLTGVEPVSGPKTIKSILKSNFTFKVEVLKGVIINEPSSAPAKSNKSASTLKINSALAGKLKNVKFEDDPSLAIVVKELNELKLQISKNQSSYSRNNKSQQCERTNHRTCDHAEYMSTMNMSQHLKGQGGSFSRSRTPRLSKHFFPPYTHCGFNDHLYDDCVNYPICDMYGSYDQDTHGQNRIISLRRGIKPRNPQHVVKSCETRCSIIHTTIDHNNIEWFKRGEEFQAKNAEALKKVESSNANRSKTPTKRWVSKQN
ncbi:hypothetical protein Tco_1045523 [Tanacetum coccineum]|uniref:Retrovirus-related Pol polyprotein from transposon TNT 1-94 n=1 Tax=Tanacetum coccineum TaxID=301880 RepID=A0ABQ5GTE9_9ASTR